VAGARRAAAGASGVNRKVLIVGFLITAPMIALFALSFGRDPHSVRSPLVGRPAPAFTLAPVGGGDPVSLASLAGKPTLVNFWATWCIPCEQEHGVLQEGARALGDRVRFIGIVYEDEPAVIQRFLDRHGSGYPTLVDVGGRTAIAYGVYGVPETFFIDAGGVIRFKYQGPLSPQMLAGYVRRLTPEGS
jgi:cytochrome c biogenesis protein CcmG/thiol:disulfide interchange protein DsbE